MPPTRYHFRCLGLIVLLYLALGLAYSVVVPLGEAPDELDHFLYVKYLAQERRLPVLRANPAKNETMEANQPPLYYLLGAAVAAGIDMAESADFPLNPCFSFDPRDPGRQHFYLHSFDEQFPYHGTFLAFHLVRVMSVFMGAGTILLAYTLGRQLAPGNEKVGLLSAALLSFNPQFLFINGSANNDVLTALLGAAIVAQSIQVIQRPHRQGYAALGLLVGLGLLTKFALLALWPLAVLAVVWPFISQSRASEDSVPRPSFLAPLLLVLTLPIAIAGWWYWRNLQLYGDPLAWNLHLQTKGDQVLRTVPFIWTDLIDFIRLHFQSYWALFGWLNVQAPAWIYGALAIVVLLAFIGLGLEVRDWQVTKKRLQTLAPSQVAVVFNCLAVLAIYVSLWRYIHTINWSGYQGRLAYAVAAPVATLLAVGLKRLAITEWRFATRKYIHLQSLLVPIAVATAMCLLAISSLFFLLAPAYPRPLIYEPAPDVPRLCARLDNWELVAYEIAPQVLPEQSLPVTFYGYGLGPGSPATLVVEIIGREGITVGHGEIALAWLEGQTNTVTIDVPVAADALPARAIVRAGLKASAGDTWLPVTSVSGRQLDAPAPVTTVKIPAAPVVNRPQHTVWATFGDGIALTGYDLEEDGRSASVTLYWQALAPLAHDYTTFIHLMDQAGRLVAQADSQPHEGAYPTSIWDVGEVVADTKSVTWPAALDPGYRLAVGVYHSETLARLRAHDQGGRPQADDLFILTAAGN